MIIKTIDIPFTGQPVVSLLEGKLVKTASNDIQEYWNSLEKSPKYAYLHVLAMTDSNHYGPNNNGDWFNEVDLKKYHNTFCSDAYIFLHHVNKDPIKSIGRPIYSFYNDNMHRVELILAIDKSNPMAAETIGKIRRGEQLYVSMGCKVPYDICSICNHRSKTRAEYCEHLKFQMKKILDDGRQVYAINPPPLKFFDISIVTRPADRVAWALDKMACEDQVSQQLPQVSEKNTDLLQTINKFSEILKTLDGEVLDYKDLDQPIIDKLQAIRRLPDYEMDLTEYTGTAPVGAVIRISISKGIPPTFAELNRAITGDDSLLPTIMRGLRGATEIFRHNPEGLFTVLRDVLQSDDHADHKDVEIVMTKRANMFKRAQLPLYQKPYMTKWHDDVPGIHKFYNSGAAVTDTFTAYDHNGVLHKTNRYNAIAADTFSSTVKSIPITMPKLVATMAGIGILLSSLSPQVLVAGGAMALLGLGGADDNSRIKLDMPLKGEVHSTTFFNKVSGELLNTRNVLAVALPTLLGMDYFVNSKIRHKDNPYYRNNMSTVGRMADTAGEFVYKHPALSIGSFLVGKGAIGEAIRSMRATK